MLGVLLYLKWGGRCDRFWRVLAGIRKVALERGKA